jgi:hypothetical protein
MLEADERIAAQRQRIERRRQAGLDTAASEDLLRAFCLRRTNLCWLTKSCWSARWLSGTRSIPKSRPSRGFPYRGAQKKPRGFPSDPTEAEARTALAQLTLAHSRALAEREKRSSSR